MPKRIAVLGAGPMGLAVAYELAKQGFSPVIFEASDRIGGMTATFDFGGLDIERYYHFHCTSDTDFFVLLDELNLRHKLQWVPTKMGFYYSGKVSPWGNPIALLRFSGLSLVAKFRYGLHAFLATKRDNWQPLDSIEASDWIKRWVGKEAFSVLWQKLFDYKFYEFSETLSAAWIWSRIRRIGRSRYNIMREQLGYLEGGSTTFLQAMRVFVESNGGEFRLNSIVKKVHIQDGAVTGVETTSGVEQFNAVISTIPLPYVPDIFDQLPKDILAQYRSVKNIAVVCIIAKLKKPVTENFWLNINDPEMDIPGLVEFSNLRPLNDHILYIPFYMPAENVKYRDSDDLFIKKVKSYILRINPKLIDDDFIDVKVNRYRYAQPICQPNFLKTLPPFELPIRGLLVADTSYYYPEDRGISESIGFGRMMARRLLQQ